MGGKTIDILEAKSEMRSAFMGGFAGRFVSSLIRLIAAALGNWHFIFQEDLFLTPYEDAEYAPPFTHVGTSHCTVRRISVSRLSREQQPDPL